MSIIVILVDVMCVAFWATVVGGAVTKVTPNKWWKPYRRIKALEADLATERADRARWEESLKRTGFYERTKASVPKAATNGKSAWVILGIEPTTDKKLIERAFRQKAKISSSRSWGRLLRLPTALRSQEHGSERYSVTKRTDTEALAALAKDMGLAGFLKERAEVLRSMDLDRLIAFYQKHNPGLRPMSRELAEVALHKARTAALDLSKAERNQSYDWLISHGYTSMDGGTLERNQ